MNKPLYLLYVTGLGDANPKGQRRAVATWRWWGVHAELYQMNWENDEPWQPKFERLLARIDDLASRYDVGLVAASAGAAAAINAYAIRKERIVGIVLIAGKVNDPDRIDERYQAKNPGFVEAAYAAPLSLKTLSDSDRRRILSRYALFDGVVARSDSHIPGAHNRMVPSVSHFLTIASQITLGAPSFIRFLKKLRSSRASDTVRS